MYKNESYDFKQFRNEITNLEALDYSVPKSIKNKSVSLTSNKSKNIANEVSYLNLNIADITSLKLIKGIGLVLAKRIVKFRNSLGGF
ncbi:MAG: ComEA family DNA-binding protein [Flavobacteriales bacterium]